MAALPSPTHIVGNHKATYQAYYNAVDPNGTGTIGGVEAARFLKRSGLSDVILSKIWELSDPHGRGFLDRNGMFTALKLVALVQNGGDYSLANIGADVPPPKISDFVMPKVSTRASFSSAGGTISGSTKTTVDWTVKEVERIKYENLFKSLQPLNGFLSGDKVKSVLIESKLPFDVLSKIWDLADQDKDGMLDIYEFITAMHLVYKALEKYEIPKTLPAELVAMMKSRKTASSLLLVGNELKTNGETATAANTNNNNNRHSNNNYNLDNNIANGIPWVVTQQQLTKINQLFRETDLDMDGFVSGQEIKDVFLQSGLEMNVLADIWALCDINQVGKLDNEQFALAMWLIDNTVRGKKVPKVLSAEMVPPRFRTTTAKSSTATTTIGTLAETETTTTTTTNARYANSELNMVGKDIDELIREKMALEADVAQKEADIKIKTGEIKSLQSELDTLSTTLKQLENQQGEAQKRLNDIKAQVEKLRQQVAEQTETVNAQEMELTEKRAQLEALRKEEQELEMTKAAHATKLASLNGDLQVTQLHISQTKALITQLQEQIRRMRDAIEACDVGIETGDGWQVTETHLAIAPDHRDAQYDPDKQKATATPEADQVENSTRNGFTMGATTSSSHWNDDDDPFKGGRFAATDPFADNSNNNNVVGFATDPFAKGAFDANTYNDDSFGGSTSTITTDATQPANKDAFGCDPFAILHAPTRDTSGGPPQRPTSPSPALPPKKGKMPPPRPAPPRPIQPPGFKKTTPTTPSDHSSNADPFAPTHPDSDGFADFSDFYNKLPPAPHSNRRNSGNSVLSSSTSLSTVTTATSQKNNNNSTLEFTDDPFRNYRYEDPFNIKFDDDDDQHGDDDSNDHPVEKKKDIDTKFDPFHLNPPLNNKNNYQKMNGKNGPTNTTSSSSQLTEKEQLKWAAMDSIHLEGMRRQRQKQEQADLELAIALSKSTK